MSHIVVSGSLAYDHIMDFPDLFRNHFLPDNLHNINVSFNVPNHNEHFGGTAGNIAYNLKLLGEEPQIVTTVGKDFAQYEKYLKGQGISLETVHRDETHSTSFAYILTDKGDNQIAAFHPGAGGTAFNAPLPTRGAKLAIISPGNLVDIRAFPGKLREAKIPFFFDPGQVIIALPQDDLRNGFDGAEVVFGNDYEFNLMCLRTGWQESDMLRHAKILVVTLGENGSRIVSQSGEVRVPAIKAEKIVDPTGAGDAYRAGYIKGYLAGLSPDICAKLGSTVAVFCVETAGTQEHKVTLADIKKRYEAGYGESFPL